MGYEQQKENEGLMSTNVVPSDDIDEDVDIVKDIDDMIKATPTVDIDDDDLAIDNIVNTPRFDDDDDDICVAADINDMMQTPNNPYDNDMNVIDDLTDEGDDDENEVFTPNGLMLDEDDDDVFDIETKGYLGSI